MELNDQVLSSYLDGELDERARADVEAALANDAGARIRLERLRDVDELLRKAIPEIPRTDADPIARRIASYDESSPESAPARRPRRAGVALLALAAGVTGLAIGIVGSGLMRGTHNVIDEGVITALNTRSSGEQESREGRTVSIVLSFRSTDGRYCRVFDVASSDVSGEGIACRRGAEWQLAGWDGTRAPGGFQPAGGDAFIDGLMDRLGGQAALESTAERKLIDAKWKD
jgi:putative zinc finger protein